MDLSSPELWIVWHKTTKKPPNAVAEACVEIIQYKLRAMPSLPAVPTDGLWHHQVRELEACRRPMRKFDHPKAVALPNARRSMSDTPRVGVPMPVRDLATFNGRPSRAVVFGDEGTGCNRSLPHLAHRFCLLCEDEEQSEVTLTGCLDDLLNGYCAPLPILAIGEKVNHHLKKG